MIGTIRTFGDEQQELVHRRIREVATHIAESAGAIADVQIGIGYPATINPPDLTSKVMASLEAAAGKENIIAMDPVTGAEDFSFFQREKPGFFFFLGGMKPGGDPVTTPSHHTPDFFIDESGLIIGVKSLSYLVVDYMGMNK